MTETGYLINIRRALQMTGVSDQNWINRYDLGLPARLTCDFFGREAATRSFAAFANRAEEQFFQICSRATDDSIGNIVLLQHFAYF